MSVQLNEAWDLAIGLEHSQARLEKLFSGIRVHIAELVGTPPVRGVPETFSICEQAEGDPDSSLRISFLGREFLLCFQAGVSDKKPMGMVFVYYRPFLDEGWVRGAGFEIDHQGMVSSDLPPDPNGRVYYIENPQLVHRLLWKILCETLEQETTFND